VFKIAKKGQTLINLHIRDGRDGWMETKKWQDTITYDSISIRYNKIPNEWILKKYCSEIDFKINKYVCIMYVNGHNLILLIYDCFIYEISISPWFSHRILINIMLSQFCAGQKYLVLNHFEYKNISLILFQVQKLSTKQELKHVMI
jgi:hypothetical protein